jgi:tetratricopeptide (TPR) repeat protein
MGRDTVVRSLSSSVIALVLCLAIARPSFSQPAPERAPAGADDFLQEATRAIAHGQIDEASALARSRSGEDPDARLVLARIALRSGRVEEAEALLAPAAEREPAGEAALELGLLRHDAGRLEEAALILEAVASSAQRATDPPALLRAARASAVLGEFRLANQLFRRASRASGGDPSVETAWGLLFLEKHNTSDASRSFREALKADDRWAPAHLGLAQALLDTNPPAATQAVDRALELDPGLIGAHVARARLAIDASRRADAREALQRALQTNPSSREARSLLAALHRVEDRMTEFEAEAQAVLRANPRKGEPFHAASELLARAYRFEEAVALGRRAAQIEPSNPRVLATLGMNLMRTGDEAEARQVLDLSFRIDPYDVVTYNLLALLDTLDEFETVNDGAFTFRFHKDEAHVLKAYAPALAREAMAALSKRYQFTPKGPILIEIFPRHDDFAVRTLGLPGLLGALGACFGRVVTMDSPRARPPNTFSWQATLWHELAHVFSLQLSNQRVPRWLTEGLSVFEETRARAGWGRETELAFARAWSAGNVPRLEDLDAGFTRPDTIALAYYQASLLVEQLVELGGEAGVIRLLRAFGEGLDTGPALQKALGTSMQSLQAAFDARLKERFGSLAHAMREVPELAAAGSLSLQDLEAIASRQPDSFQVQYQLARALAASGDHARAVAAFERAAALVPRVPGPESPRAQLAALAAAEGDTARARRELAALIEYDHTNVDAARQLLGLAETSRDVRLATLAAERVVALDPFDSAAHSSLGRAALAAGDHETALHEFSAALATGPADSAAAHCDLGEAFLAAGRAAEAKRQALASLEIAPLFERAQELLLKVVDGGGKP